MSIYHSKKCTRQEALTFLNDVKEWCDSVEIYPVKTLALTAYEGEIRLYNGKEETRISKKRVRQQDENGYFLAKTKIKKPCYTQVFRAEWYNPEYQTEEKQAIKDFFKEEGGRHD